jgi:galactose-1-phosphate uridylyltransferase
MEFNKIVKEAVFLDPQKDFQEVKLPIEIRKDPLTGKNGRIVNFRFKLPQRPDFREKIESSKNTCPFCPERLEKVTPKFPLNIIPEGRIRVNNATLFPNSMPYERNSAVVIFSNDHFIDMNEFNENILIDALTASKIYFERVSNFDPSTKYMSINWNYMPPSGAGLIHPHLQTIASDIPTNYHKDILTASKNYYENSSRNFWDDLLNKEEEIGERFIGIKGNIGIIASFVPQGMMGDLLLIFKEVNSILNISEEDIRDFAYILKNVLRYLYDQNFYSFNMAVYFGLKGEEYLWTNARIVPRMTIPPMDTGDVNYFEKLHGEIFIVKSPEDLAQEIREYL